MKKKLETLLREQKKYRKYMINRLQIMHGFGKKLIGGCSDLL